MGDSYSNVPWWSALVAALLSAVAAAIGTVIALRGGTPTLPGAPAGMSAILTDTIAYTPHILLLFGVLADIFTMEGVYSIPSLVGLLSVFVNYVLMYLWLGLEQTVGYLTELVTKSPSAAVMSPVMDMRGGSTYDGCRIQGLGGWESPYAPQVLVVTATVFFYYMIDLIINRGATAAAGTIVTFAVVYGVQASSIQSCTALPGFFWKALTALAEGLLIGGAAYGVVQASAPNRLPTAVLRKATAQYSAGDMTKNASGQMIGPDGSVYTLGTDGSAVPVSSGVGAMGNVSSGAAAAGTCPPGTR